VLFEFLSLHASTLILFF